MAAGYYNPYPYSYYSPIQQMQQPQPNLNPQQIQNGGFISVRNEMEARNYPIAPGNSITFKDETAPYVYTKTMGFSQLDRPIFDKYKLVKEEVSENVECVAPHVDNTELQAVKNEIEKLWYEINAIKTNAEKKSVIEEKANGGNN